MHLMLRIKYQQLHKTWNQLIYLRIHIYIHVYIYIYISNYTYLTHLFRIFIGRRRTQTNEGWKPSLLCFLFFSALPATSSFFFVFSLCNLLSLCLFLSLCTVTTPSHPQLLEDIIIIIVKPRPCLSLPSQRDRQTQEKRTSGEFFLNFPVG